MRPAVSIALATFNGERHVGEQLDSILGQRLDDSFEIVVRDDGSTDSTLEIVKRHAGRPGARVRLLEPDGQRLGPKNSFARLLGACQGDYVGFCDQDDVWQPTKLAAQLQVLRRLESKRGASTPLLCCGDAAVTDATLSVTDASFFRKHRFNFEGGRDRALPRLLFRNYAIGATTLMNRALAQSCHAMPEDAVMHDWWAALVATCLGEVAVIEEPLILYRQHPGNAVGSRRRPVPRTLGQVAAYRELTLERTEACLRQATALYQRFGSQMSTAQADTLRELATLTDLPAWKRLGILLRRRPYKPGWLLNGVHLYSCLRALARAPSS